MIDETKRIVKKLPKDLQEEFNKDYAINPKYSHKWKNWALDIIERFNTVILQYKNKGKGVHKRMLFFYV